LEMPKPGMLTWRSRGIDMTLIVEELELRRTSSMVSVFDMRNGSPARWSDPISKIVCGCPGLGSCSWGTLMPGLIEMSPTSVETWSRPATAVVAAVAPIITTAASTKRHAVPPRLQLPGTRLLRWRLVDVTAWLAKYVVGAQE